MPALSKPIIVAAVVVPMVIIPAALSFANRTPEDVAKKSAFDRVSSQRAARGEAKIAAAREAKKQESSPLAKTLPPTVIKGEYIVTFKDGARTAPSRRASVARTITSRKGKVHAEMPRMGAMVAKIDAATAATLSKDAAVVVEPNTIMKASGRQDSPPSWGIDRIDQRDLPLTRSFTSGPTGKGVTAYIIDTGLNSAHQEFSGRVKPGFSVVNDRMGTEDCAGHGTHVAGTVAGSTFGVAKEATVVPVRVLGCDGRGDTGGIIKAMDWVIAHASKPAVVNMSLGGGASQALDDAVGRLTAAGITVSVASGNENNNACTMSPARAPQAITVGNSTMQDRRASSSNWGGCVDIMAPGTDIVSAWKGGPTARLSATGTSMASPHVAGVAALYLERNPQATVQQVTSAVLDGATVGKIDDLKGSPNVLLYSGVVGDDTARPTSTSTPAPIPTATPDPTNPGDEVTETVTVTTTAFTTVTVTAYPGLTGGGNRVNGTLSQFRGRNVGTFTVKNGQKVAGNLKVDPGVSTRLILQMDNGSFWQTVARRDELVQTTNSVEKAVRPGRYRWVAVALRGQGKFEFTHVR